MIDLPKQKHKGKQNADFQLSIQERIESKYWQAPDLSGNVDLWARIQGQWRIYWIKSAPYHRTKAGILR